ncbi:MAG: hypothetical protein EXR99_09370 [Gemmataceae bacterium]|nr:hypothetical protein [Gemmataceae bacterium]
MSLLGKLALYLTALASFSIATWAFSLWSNPLLTPKGNSWEEIEEGRTKLDKWYTPKGFENEVKVAAVSVASNRYADSRGKILGLESHVKEIEDYYQQELDFLKKKADGKSLAKAIKLVNGQPVGPKTKEVRMVPLEMVDVRDLNDKVLSNLEAQEKKIIELRKAIAEKQTELVKIAMESQELVIQQTGPTGLQQHIEAEKIKRKGVGEEFEAIQDKLISLGVETDDLFKRRKELQKRLVELSSSGVISLP